MKIQTKFIILIATALLTLSFLIGSFSFSKTSSLSQEDAEVMMNAVCSQQAARLDLQLVQAEQAAQTVLEYTLGRTPYYEDLSNEVFRKSLIHDVGSLSSSVIKMVDGGRCIYLRLAPEATGDNFSGFFMVYDRESGNFYPNALTDITAYPETDLEHVGWYYIPRNNGAPLWMSPYMNQNIGVELISYVQPIYVEEKFVGVIGVDLDFQTFIDLAQDASVYENGQSGLVDMSSYTIYYNMFDGDRTYYYDDKITDVLYKDLKSNESSDMSLLTYPSAGVNYSMAYRTLGNGMKYILLADTDEINAARDEVLINTMIYTLSCLVVFILCTMYAVKRITKPLEKLNAAAKDIAAGNWDVDINFNSKDEVGTLAENIRSMSKDLKEYVSAVNQMAFKDALTCVKNKAFYQKYITEMPTMDDVDAGLPNSNYAVVVFDINSLKDINDKYGHEAGDCLIVDASRYICQVYAHSPIFRIGGDEFVAVLRGIDYTNREDMLVQFEEGLAEIKMHEEPFAPISIAFGMAECSKTKRTYDAVFKSADEAMYEKKRQMKKGRVR